MYHSSNDRREITNSKFYDVIFQGVVEKINRPLNELERKKTITFINDMDPDLFKPKLKNKTVSIMVSTLSDEFIKYNCVKDVYDIQDELRQTIGTTGESGTSSSIYDAVNFGKPSQTSQSSQTIQPSQSQPSQSQTSQLSQSQSEPENRAANTFDSKTARLLNPGSFFRKNYIVLDSRYRMTDNAGQISSFKWVYNLGSQTAMPGSVSAIGNVREIVSMKVYPFRIPYVASADNKYSRVSVLLNNFSSQAFISNENRKFHFMLQSQIDSDFIDLSADNYNDIYHFENPVTTASIIEVSFGSPLLPILFDNDRDTCVIDYFSNAPMTKITTTSKHNLSNGDQVYFSNFNVGDVNAILSVQKSINDNIKNTINGANGFLITVLDDYSFSIDFDSSNIQNPVNSQFNVYYGSKRIFMPIEFTFIMPEK